jgi:hypothetical protein
MQLNRSVVLECPELDVPWFHEQYCQETMSISKSGETKSVIIIFVGIKQTILDMGSVCLVSHFIHFQGFSYPVGVEWKEPFL